MANSLRPVSQAVPLETDSTFHHEASQKIYTVSRTGQRRSTALGDTYEVSATHTIGSGKNARSYLHRASDGELTQLPLSWYTQEQRWAMSPGYESANHADFARTVEGGCLFCHTAATQKLEEGIDCQRCHGPGSDHAKAPTKTNIVRYGGQDTCLQCHLQSTSDPLPHAVLRVGRDLWSYRPGERLSEYAVHFQEPEQMRRAKFEINSHGYRLRQSPCVNRSGAKLECVRCHDPHGETSLTAVRERARTVCLSCHSPHPEQARNDCTGCHMPRRRTQDARHVMMTDHRIAARTPAEGVQVRGTDVLELLDPIDDPGLYLGLAYLRRGDLPRGVELLRSRKLLPNEAKLALLQANALEPDDFTPAARDEEFAVGEALMRRGRFGEAAAHLRRALPMPKAQMAVAFLAVREGRTAESARWWFGASESAPLRAEALTNLSRLRLEAGDAAEALVHARQATAFEPNSLEANLAYSRALAAQGALSEARQRAARAVELNPKHSDARYHYGRLLQAAGNPQAASEQYEACLRLDPASFAAHLSLGVTLAQMGQRTAAADHFRRALELKPDLEEAKRNLKLVEAERTRPSHGEAVSGPAVP